MFDANGRFAPQYNDDDVMTLEADACVLAIGQQADLSFLTAQDGVALRPGGTIKIDPATLATSAPGIYAGGDVAFGPRNLIEAVANGKRAARSIHEYLAGDRARHRDHHRRREAPHAALPRCWPASSSSTARRRRPRTSAAAPASPRSRPATTPTPPLRQAARCLVCHVQTIYDPEKCVLCNRCVDICPEYCLAIVPFETLDLDPELRGHARRRAPKPAASRWRRMVKDDDRCIRCGLCAIRCPTDAMTMERFSITERWTHE